MSVPRLWPGATVVCIACGPSLTPVDVDAVRDARTGGRVHVIAINAAVRVAPWADVRYAHHAADWRRAEDVEFLGSFRGLRYAMEPEAAKLGAEVLRTSGPEGLELEDRGAVRDGRNSGYQAIGVAVHLGACRVVLLGYDLARDAAGRLHFYPCAGTTGRGEFATWRALYATLPAPLALAGVEVLNATRGGALEVFPRVSLEAALAP